MHLDKSKAFHVIDHRYMAIVLVEAWLDQNFCG